MEKDLYTAALSRAAEANLSVMELIQIAEAVKPTHGLKGSLTLYETWIQHNEDHPLLHGVLFNYSVAQSEAEDLQGARTSLERILILNPDFSPAYINLGRIYERMGATRLAILQWSNLADKLGVINGLNISHKITALNQMARVLESNNQDATAESTLRQSLEIDPRQHEAAQHFVALRQRQCQWPVIAPWDRVSREALMKGISPLSIAAYTDDPMLHLASAWHYNLHDVGAPASDAVKSHWAARQVLPGARLRIGYLSSDLREHAIGHLTAEIYGLHDRSKVEVFVYYCGIPHTDPLQERIKAEVDHWISINGMDDAAAARRIADDGIQILVDVNGYTRDGRTKLVALRPAPVIVNWLGFPGSMGSPYHHYIIADDWIIPPENEIYYSERVLRLPCYQPNDRKRIVADKQPTRADYGLPEDAMVYCSFNGTHKITRFTFDRWLTILERVPGSVLWLLSGAESSHVSLKAYAEKRGIDPARLIFAEKLANPYHLARYPLADLFIDTTPYGAHTTASDALWMGVPVLTMSGRSFASRVCGSLVRSAGFPDLVCNSSDEFVDRAVALGRDRSMVQHYKDRLAASRESSVLFDTPRLVRGLESLYAQMWDDCVNDRLPQPDLHNLDVYLEVGIQPNVDALEVQEVKDYRGWWRERLAKRHAYRPIPPDNRFWTA